MNEKIFVDINGRKQGMFLQSENTDNPVLLFLHGGPGSPEVPFTQSYPNQFEKLFTVCYWEQRGSGISYSFSIKPSELNMEQMISDTVEVTNYLRSRFKKDKIYVMGHSWGSLLGTLVAKQNPELFHAYIGIGQVAQQDKSERLAYRYMLSELTKANNKTMLKKLKKYPIDNNVKISISYLGLRSSCMNMLGIGVMRKMKSMSDCVAVVMKFKGYTFGEKLKFVIGSGVSLKSLWDSVLKVDLFKLVPQLDIPVYIFHGKYDYQVSYEISKKYAAALKAPVKGFYTFENSAHSPCFEEPEKICNILKTDVLQTRASLADKI